TSRDHRKSRFHCCPFELGIDFEVAEELLGRRLFVLAVERLQVGTRTQANLRDRARQLGGIALAIGHGARYRIDDDVLRSGIVLGTVRICDVEDIACKFDEGVLKPSAGAEKWPIAAP